MTDIRVWVGDITELPVAAVVNAANSRLAGGGGVDGAIHRAAGNEALRAACVQLGGCTTGQVKLTGAFKLPARAIIHAVGPIWQGGGQGEAVALRSCYRQAMLLAEREGFESIAFPAISCGVYGYPLKAAVDIATSEVLTCLADGRSRSRSDVDHGVNGSGGRSGEGGVVGSDDGRVVKQVIFCCFSEEMALLYRQRLQELDVEFNL